MRRRFIKPFRKTNLDFVDGVIREIKRELMREPQHPDQIHSGLKESRARSLLTDLMDLKPGKSTAPIYH